VSKKGSTGRKGQTADDLEKNNKRRGGGIFPKLDHLLARQRTRMRKAGKP